MKNSEFIKEMVASVVLIILLGAFLNPFILPTMFQMMLLLALLVAFAFFATYIWKERPRDERESLHKMLAGRDGFLAGATVLVIGIILQSLNHALDPWLIITLTVMVLAKIAGLIRAQLRH